MAIPPANAPDIPPTTALAATWHQMRQSALRHAVVVGGLCLGIALILTSIDGFGFAYKIAYSLSIGLACTFFVDASRLVAAWLTDRTRRSRGLPAQSSDAATLGWRGVIPGSLLAVLLGPPAGLWLGDQITGLQSPSLLNLNTTTRLTLVLSLLGTVFSVVVISTLERLASARALAEAAQRQAAETQLRLLQSQLEPHMLFNTLANLRVLIGLDSARAQAMLDHLIAFLRATLQASRSEAHALATEFQRVDDYLALMGVRMGARLQVALQLPPALRAVAVPPLLLQPLVENAIKHGLEPKVEGGRVEVRAWQEGQTLCLSVRDTGVGLTGAMPGDAGGFGTTQIRERLATLYGGRATATLAPAPDAEGGTLATLRLPLPAAPAVHQPLPTAPETAP